MKPRVTPSENRRRGGQENLTAEQVRQIRERPSRGETQVSIAADSGVTQSHVSRINTSDRGLWAGV